VSFAAITLCVASQRVFFVVIYFVMTQSGNFWIHTRIKYIITSTKLFKIRSCHMQEIVAAIVSGKKKSF
jgi:hypothetical protein